MWFCVNKSENGKDAGCRKIVAELQKGGRKYVVLCG